MDPPDHDADSAAAANAQVTAILATIRANLALVACTWGRESRQHREARGVMRAYLEENVLRHRHRHRHRLGDGGEGEGKGGDDVEMNTGVERERARDTDMDIDRGIEEVLAELSLS